MCVGKFPKKFHRRKKSTRERAKKSRRTRETRARTRSADQDRGTRTSARNAHAIRESPDHRRTRQRQGLLNPSEISEVSRERLPRGIGGAAGRLERYSEVGRFHGHRTPFQQRVTIREPRCGIGSEIPQVQGPRPTGAHLGRSDNPSASLQHFSSGLNCGRPLKKR